MNEKRAFREEVGEGIRRLGVIWRSRRKQRRAFWGENSICKGRMLRKEVKHLWELTCLLNVMGQRGLYIRHGLI